MSLAEQSTEIDALRVFANGLKELHRDAGKPSLRFLARWMQRHAAPQGGPSPRGFAKSSIEAKLRGDSAPTPEFVLLFVEACAAWARSHGHLLPDSRVQRDSWLKRLDQTLLDVETERDNARRSADASEKLRLRVVPQLLPPTAPYFVGRDRELAELTAILDDADGRPATPSVALVTGASGAGKSSLAVWWAHTVADRFPGGRLYLDLRRPDGTPVLAVHAVRTLLNQLGERAPVAEEDQVELLRARLARQRVIIVLDNAMAADQVRPLLPAASAAFVLVTSRSTLHRLVESAGARSVHLGPFSADQARELIVERLTEKVLTADPAATATVVEACAGLPLAVNVAAAIVESRQDPSLRGLAEAVTVATERLGSSAAGRDGSEVLTVFRLSYAYLEPEAARVFRLLALHPGPVVTYGVVASLAATTPQAAGQVIAALIDRYLLEERQSGRYAMHDLLRDYATVLVDAEETAEEQRAAVSRVLDFYLHTAHEAAAAWDPQRDPLTLSLALPGVAAEPITGEAEGLGWLRRHYQSLLRFVPAAIERGFDARAWQLAWSISDFLNRQGYWHDLAALAEQGLSAARRSGDNLAEARMRRLLGRAYELLERLDDSDTQLESALRLFSAAGDQAGQAHVYIDLSRNAEHRNDYSRGADLARKAAQSYAAAGNVAGEANALNGVGLYLSLGGEHEQALAICEQALLQNRAARDRSGEAATLDSIGAVHLQLGNLDSAESYLVAAAALFAETGDPGQQAGSLTRLADVHVEAARVALRQAAGIFDSIDARSAADQARDRLSRLD